MRRLLCVVAALIGLASPALATGYEDTTRAKFTLGRMFTQAGTFGLPPYASDPFACSSSVSSERTMYYNTTFHSVVYCNGSTWTTLGTSSGLSSPVAGDYVWTGKQTFGSGVDGANTVRVGDTAGAVVFEGSTADGFETTLGVTDPTADVRFNLPAPTAGTYSLLSTAAAVSMAQGGTDVTTAADDQVLVSSGSAWVAKTVPACTDVTGNHLNYDQATNSFSCGTSGGVTSPVGGDFVATGKWTFGSAADAAGSVRLGETASGIVFEGATLDAFETTLTVVDPTADNTYRLPAATAGTYDILTSANAVTLAQGGTGLSSAADDTVPVSTGSAWVAKTLPSCTDTGGNHLNYDQASNAFSCGTSSGAGGSTFLDGSFKIENTADNTKIVQFSSASIGTGTTKTFALPNATGTLPTIETSSNWSSQLMSAGQAWSFGGTQYGIIGTTGGLTPGGIYIGNGSLSRSIRFGNYTFGTDVKNGPCGTSACTDATLILFSHNEAIAEYGSLVHDGTNFLLQTGTGAVAVQPGTGTGRALVGGALNTNISPVGNGADVTEDNLMTYTLPANSLSANGRGVHIRAWGITANNADTKTLKCYFGSTAIMTGALTTSVAGAWDVDAVVLMTGATGQEAIARLNTTTAVIAPVDTQPGETLSGTVVIKCTGQANATNANDIKQNGMVVEYIN